MTQVLVTDVFSAAALGRLKGAADCEIHLSQALRPTEKELADCEVLLVRSRTQVDTSLLKMAPHLKLIVTATAGFDHIDYAACSERDIKVAYTPDANAQSAAELTIALMLMWARRLPRAVEQVRKHHWRTDELRGEVLNGKTLGIIGLGRIGQRVAHVARAIGMKLAAYDPYVDTSVFQHLGVERLGLSELLIGSDFVSLHVPLTEETFHLINYQTLRVINPEAVLINASRGAVIEELELAVAMDEGILRGVALDVLEREPLGRESRLRGRDNVILTPHVGAFTEEALELASLEAIDKVLEFLGTGSTRDMLPLPAPWFKKVLKS